MAMRSGVAPERAVWHREQFDTPKRSTVALREFAAKTVGKPGPRTVLDAGCGGGRIWPTSPTFGPVHGGPGLTAMLSSLTPVANSSTPSASTSA